MLFPIIFRPRGAFLLLGLLSAIVLLAAGCAGTGEFRPVPVIPSGGGSSAPSAPAQPVQLAAPPATQKMLQDPEAQQPSEYDEPIIAASPEEAERICRQKAQRDGVKLVRVQGPKDPKLGKNQRYYCWFQGSN